MAYDFPANPAVGQSYPTGDKTYVWNGYAWSLDPIPGLPSSSEYVLKVGDTMTGHLTLNADPVNPLHAATKQYVGSGKTANDAVKMVLEQVIADRK